MLEGRVFCKTNSVSQIIDICQHFLTRSNTKNDSSFEFCDLKHAYSLETVAVITCEAIFVMGNLTTSSHYASMDLKKG